MKTCQIKGNEPYPYGCKGWSLERDGVRCLDCKHYGKKPMSFEQHYEQPAPYVPKPMFDTWSRQFVKTKIDERW